MTRLVLASFCVTSTALVNIGSWSAIAADRPTRAVVELFTSQGCSSCPPADALLQRLVQDPSIVALSFPVDYWDYLGWKDTFAKPEFSARQRDYAAIRGDREVYTPQMVIDGRAHAVGSDAEGINAEITAQIAAGALPVGLNVEMVGDTVTVHLSGTARSNDVKATVWLVKFSRSETVAIGRGENVGHSVTYVHVVKDMQPVGMWKGQAMTVELPRDVLTSAKNFGFALLVQTDVKGRPGPILGATILSDGTAS